MGAAHVCGTSALSDGLGGTWRVRIGHMTRDAVLVSIQIAKVGAVIVFVILRSWTGRTLAGTAIRKGDCVNRPHHFMTRGQKRHHLTVARMMRVAIMGLTNDKVGTCSPLAVPTRPWTTCVVKAELVPKLKHNGTVEAKRSIKVSDADKYMGEQSGSCGLAMCDA